MCILSSRKHIKNHQINLIMCNAIPDHYLISCYFEIRSLPRPARSEHHPNGLFLSGILIQQVYGILNPSAIYGPIKNVYNLWWVVIRVIPNRKVSFIFLPLPMVHQFLSTSVSDKVWCLKSLPNERNVTNTAFVILLT